MIFARTYVVLGILHSLHSFTSKQGCLHAHGDASGASQPSALCFDGCSAPFACLGQRFYCLVAQWRMQGGFGRLQHNRELCGGLARVSIDLNGASLGDLDRLTFASLDGVTFEGLDGVAYCSWVGKKQLLPLL